MSDDLTPEDRILIARIRASTAIWTAAIHVVGLIIVVMIAGAVAGPLIERVLG